jgi:hypothetical protein
MEQVSLYRKVIRGIKGGAKRLEAANHLIDDASNIVELQRMTVREKLDRLNEMIPTTIRRN